MTLVEHGVDPLAALFSNPPALPQEGWGARLSTTDLEAGVVLVGAGRLGQTTAEALATNGYRVLGFADNDMARWGARIDGVEIVAPEEAVRRHGLQTPLVVTIYNGNAPRRQLAARGFRAFHFADLYCRLADLFLPHCCLDDPGKTFAQRKLVMEAYGLWADQASREEYLRQVGYRLGLLDELPPGRPPSETYLADDVVLPPVTGIESIIDCGGFNGDSMRMFLRVRGESCRITAVEPDPEQAAHLRAFVAACPPALRARLEVVEAALGRESGQVAFLDAHGVESRVSSLGRTTVVQMALNELAPKAPTYVKMDIEGAEYEALLGAARLLRGCRPVVAACLYHRFDDLWTVPALISSLAPDYALYLRRYADNCWEQVCFAVPNERVRR